jgi:hypothetical protein
MPRFEVISGLPPYGPPATAFPASGVGAHRQGFVVRFNPEVGEPWTGDFQLGMTKFCGVFDHPDEKHVVVISGGNIYVIDPGTQGAEELPGMVVAVTSVSDGKALLFNEALYLSLITPAGVKWRSKRLSWDGIRNVSVAGDFVLGEGWRYDETWHKYRVFLETGEFSGGAYESADP